MNRVLFASAAKDWALYERPLQAAFAKRDLAVELRREFAPDEVDYIIYSPQSSLVDFTSFTRLKALFNLWAGVEKIAPNPTLKVPLCRMVDPGLTQGMVEWVTGHVLRYHLGMDEHILGQDGRWRGEVHPPLARARRVGFLGLGELGQACAKTLKRLDFSVAGWSRREKSVDGIDCYHGADGLADILARSEILVLLLPDTSATRYIINAQRLAQLPKGAFLINPGRGPLVEETALLQALDRGDLAHATLDVFAREPLPGDHAFWAHPKVTVTPHIAAVTRPETASQMVAENLARALAGEALLHEVDREAGY